MLCKYYENVKNHEKLNIGIGFNYTNKSCYLGFMLLFLSLTSQKGVIKRYYRILFYTSMLI